MHDANRNAKGKHVDAITQNKYAMHEMQSPPSLN